MMPDHGYECECRGCLSRARERLQMIEGGAVSLSCTNCGMMKTRSEEVVLLRRHAKSADEKFADLKAAVANFLLVHNMCYDMKTGFGGTMKREELLTRALDRLKEQVEQ